MVKACQISCVNEIQFRVGAKNIQEVKKFIFFAIPVSGIICKQTIKKAIKK